MEAAWVSRRISSWVLTRRASMNTCWPSTTVMPCGLQRQQDGQFDDVDTERCVQQAELLQLVLDLVGHLSAMPASGWNGAAQGGDAGPGAALEPRPLGAVVRGVRVGVSIYGR